MNKGAAKPGRVAPGFSASCALDLEASGFEFRDEGVTVIALDLDDPVLERAACAAFSLQVAGEFLEFVRIDGDAGHGRNGLSLSSFGRTSDAHDAIAGFRGSGDFTGFDARSGALATAFTARFGAPTFGADPPALARIDESISAFVSRHL